MSRDFGELEREFISELKARTGRSLDEWMSAIDTIGLRDKNAIIDWLRPQGFTFANASWLERIHHNGGKPIYSVHALGGTAPPAGPETVPVFLKAAQPTVAANENVADTSPPPNAAKPEPPIQPVVPKSLTIPTGAMPPVATPSGDVEAAISQGKAYRPLALMVLNEVQRNIPGVSVTARGALIEFANPDVFAVLLVSARGLRLGLAGNGANSVPGLQPARITGAPPHVTETVILTDARQIDDGLRQAIISADQRIKSAPMG